MTASAIPMPGVGSGVRVKTRAITVALSVAALLALILVVPLMTVALGGGGGRIRVAMVDDNWDLYKASLDRHALNVGWDVAYFSTCEDALANPDLGTFRLFLVDYQMWGGMDGVECTPLLRARCPDAIILGFTSSRRPLTRELYMEAGANGTVVKEISIGEHTIEAILGFLH